MTTRLVHQSRARPPAGRIGWEEHLAGRLKDPAFRLWWEEHFLANDVSIELIRYRAKHRLTQAGLAMKLGVSQPYVNNLEDGEHMPTISTLKKLADALGITFVVEVSPDHGPRLLPAERTVGGEQKPRAARRVESRAG